MAHADLLWFAAFMLVSVVAVLIAVEISVYLGIAFWFIATVILAVLRPE